MIKVEETQLLQIVQEHYREAGKPPQAVLAELLDVSVSTVSREMSGDQALDVKRCAEYCALLGMLVGCDHPSVRNRPAVRVQKCIAFARDAQSKAPPRTQTKERPLC